MYTVQTVRPFSQMCFDSSFSPENLKYLIDKTRLQAADPDQAQKLFTDGLLHALLSLPQDNQNTCTVEYLLSAMIL